MKPAVYFLWFLCAVFLLAGRPAHASNLAANGFRQSLSVKPNFTFDGTVRAACFLPGSGQTTADNDPDFGLEDDDEELEHNGRPPMVVKLNMVVVALCDLPPPVSLLSKSIAPADLPSLLRPCRYLAHRALLI